MGHLIQSANVMIGAVGLDPKTAKKLGERLHLTGFNDPGTIISIQYKSLSDCREAIHEKKINAICIDPEAFTPDEVTAFISDIRITCHLVPICLIGTSSFLDDLPGYHQAWKQKLCHYYKIKKDLSESDFCENAGIIRDLLIADEVKTSGLGRYDTTPGVPLQLKSPRPYGFFWVFIAVPIIAAIAGAAASKAIEHTSFSENFFLELFNKTSGPVTTDNPLNPEAKSNERAK